MDITSQSLTTATAPGRCRVHVICHALSIIKISTSANFLIFSVERDWIFVFFYVSKMRAIELSSCILASFQVPARGMHRVVRLGGRGSSRRLTGTHCTQHHFDSNLVKFIFIEFPILTLNIMGKYKLIVVKSILSNLEKRSQQGTCTR